MCDLGDQEPTSYEEVVEKKEWVEAMRKEYESIMKNDVWDIVPKLENKSVVYLKWIYKIKHAVNGSIENKRQDLWLEDSLRKRELIMKRHLCQYKGTLLSKPSWHLHP